MTTTIISPSKIVKIKLVSTNAGIKKTSVTVAGLNELSQSINNQVSTNNIYGTIDGGNF